MKRRYWILIFAGILIFCGIIVSAQFIGKTATTLAENAPIAGRRCYIIDAGHGGIDGGAVSCTGEHESHINLEIAVRLNDLLNLLGYDTKMIRTEDISVYTSGNTIAEQKSSDLKERVRIVNETENGILLSIHQNHYSDSFYSGAQMFYPPTKESEELAKALQNEFVNTLNPGSSRKAKPAQGIYLMRHINKTGVLIECGFLSNYEEEHRLREPQYQKQICCVIASVCSRFYQNNYEI